MNRKRKKVCKKKSFKFQDKIESRLEGEIRERDLKGKEIGGREGKSW